MVSGWSVFEYVTSADTARVSSRAYGAACWARCCALMIRDAAMSSMARVIFLVDSTERIRARYSRSESAISDHLPWWRGRTGARARSALPLPDDLLLLELLVGHRVGLGLRAGLDRLTFGGLELVEELVVRRLDLGLGVVVEG